MKTKIKIAMAALISAFAFAAGAEVVAYKLTMNLKVPRVYDNMKSMGYRKVQSQKIVAYIYVDKALGKDQTEPIIEIYDVVNKTHKVSGQCVTYGDTEAEDVMWRYIGSNKTGVFKNTNIRFSLDLDPSYNIGEDEPDNALIITLSGYGQNECTIKGYVTGQIGCGCYEYGHVSPTRTIGCLVSDITPLCGSFSMKRVARYPNCTLK